MENKPAIFWRAFGLAIGLAANASAGMALESAPAASSGNLLELPAVHAAAPSVPAATPSTPATTAPSPSSAPPSSLSPAVNINNVPLAVPSFAPPAPSSSASTAARPAPTSQASSAAPAAASPAAAHPGALTPDTAPVVAAPSDYPTKLNTNAPMITPVEHSETLPKDSNLLLIPMHLGQASLLFSKADIDVITPFLEVYDSTTTTTKKQETSQSENDDLFSLLQSVKSQKDTSNGSTAKTIPQLPNLYLGSIVYYSPDHWSIWINGKKIVNRFNIPENTVYISRISRAEVEIIWRPPNLLDTGALWQEKTNKGKDQLPGIMVDDSKGRIILQMRPNQTFLPRSLVIREGLLKFDNAPPYVEPPAADASASATIQIPDAPRH